MSFSRDQSLGYLVNWAGRLLTRLADKRLNHFGMTAGQIPVFIALAADGPASQKSLAQAAAIEQPTMAATLSRMERDGLVARKPHPVDGRSTLVSLTPQMLDRTDPILRTITAINEDALRTIPEADRQTILAGLRIVIAQLEISLARGNLRQ